MSCVGTKSSTECNEQRAYEQFISCIYLFISYILMYFFILSKQI